DDDRPTLDRAGDVERAAHRQVFALVVEHMQLVGIEIKSAIGVADEGVIRPAIPKAGHHVIELARAGVALSMHDKARRRWSTRLRRDRDARSRRPKPRAA